MKKIVDLLEEAAEEIENCYGKETELSERLRNVANNYEDAEEQGRLVVLPCKTGDTAYWAYQNEDAWEYRQCVFIAAGNNEYVIEIQKRSAYNSSDFYSYMKRWIYVFATEQEAAEYCTRSNNERIFIPCATEAALNKKG